MTIEEWGKAIAESVLHMCEQCGLSDLDADDVRESLSDMIASVPKPEPQHDAMALAEAVRAEAKRYFADPEHEPLVDLDAVIASVPKSTNFLRIETELVDQPAPDVQPCCNPADDAAHRYWQAQIDAARERGIRESAGIVERCGFDVLRDKILAQIGMGKVQP